MAWVGNKDLAEQIVLWTTHLIEGNEIEMKNIFQKMSISKVVIDKKYLARRNEVDKDLEKKKQEYILNERRIRIEVPKQEVEIKDQKVKERDISNIMQEIRTPKKMHIKRDAPKYIF